MKQKNFCDHLTKRGDYSLPPTHREIMRSISSENDTVFFYLTSEEGPRKLSEEIVQMQKSPVSVNSIYEKYSSFCYATAHARPVGLRVFLMRMTELGNFMGFKVDGLTVYGLTLDKTQGEILCRDLQPRRKGSLAITLGVRRCVLQMARR